METTCLKRPGGPYPDIPWKWMLAVFVIWLVPVQTGVGQILAAEHLTRSQTEQNHVNLREVHLSLDLEQVPLDEAILQIGKQAGVAFYYNSRTLSSDQRVTYSGEHVSLGQILDTILPADIRWFTVRNFVILQREPGSEDNTSESVIEQNRVTGRVVDSQTGEPLPGVNVLLEGTSTGTVTDTDGQFELEVDPASMLVFTYIGYERQEVALEGRSVIEVELVPTILGGDEIVVIGYGAQRRAEVTSAVASIDASDFVTSTVRDAGQLLQGKFAGLIINTPSGNPAASSQILLRGIATLESSTQPLILVDGIPGSLNDVAPEDIQSINVLKDGSAAAIYGTRGSNGVILITTRDMEMTPTLRYEGSLSTQSFINPPDMLSPDQYRQRLAEGTSGFQDLGHNTDWMQEVSRRTPVSQVHNLSLSGGSSQTSYMASLGYRDFEGVFLETGRSVLNGRVNLRHRMFDNKVSFNLQFLSNQDQYNSLGPGTSFDDTIYKNAFTRNPTAPVMNADGTWHEQPAISYYENPKALIHESSGLNERLNSRINGDVTWFPISDLMVKALVSYNRNSVNYGYTETKNHISTTRDQAQGRAYRSNSLSTGQLFELTGEYARSFTDHSFTLLGGYSYQENDNSSASINNTGFPPGSFVYHHNIGIGSGLGEGIAGMSSGRGSSNLISFFGRVTYNYREKYLLSGSLRYEAASQFLGTNKPWGTFPAISAGWVISEEGFMAGAEFIDEIKLRVGFGITGTAPNASFLAVSRLGYSGNFLIDGNWTPNLVPVNNPNPHLRWEEKEEINVGTDFSLFAGRVSGSMDIYSRTTDGLLYEYPVPSPPNLYNTTIANVGVMKNQGVELQVNILPVVTNEFRWSTSLNFSTNRNELVSLSNDMYQRTADFINTGHTGSPVQTYTHRVEVGREIGNFFGHKVIDITDDGFWVYEDADGNATTEPVEADKKILGNGLPNYYAGWNNTLNYRNFDLSVTMRGAFDFQILNYTRMYYEVPGFELYNQLNSAYDDVFGKTTLNRSVSPSYNSYYVEDGDYWKIDNITLGYNFDLTNFNYLRSARVYISSLNTFVLTGYKGSDPEVNSIGLSPGNDSRDKFPSTRVLNLGVQLSFN